MGGGGIGEVNFFSRMGFSAGPFVNNRVSPFAVKRAALGKALYINVKQRLN